MRSLVVVVLGACSFHNNGATGDGAVQSDGAQVDGHVDPHVDGAPDVPRDASNCYGGGLATVCLTAPPGGDYDVPTATTTAVATDSMCTQVVPQTSGPALCVIAGVNVHIDGTLDATGMRPLVLVATDTLEVTGKIDAGSYRIIDSLGNITGDHVGAGEAANALCAGATVGGNDTGGGTGGNGAGGGAGGTFGGRGGSGAAGRNGAGGTAGASAAVGAAPTFVRGGCAGTAGGNSTNLGGAPGHGGGAVYLIARSQITVSGVITASGEGGYGGAIGAGGGGAGAGGLIGLDAPAVTSSGTIFANGGGGGEGGGQNGGGTTGNSAMTATTAAPGGSYNTNGGDGGEGSVSTTLGGGPGMTNNNGGGAGGGGAGVIRVFPAQALGGTVSPPAT